ncbi:bifunctional [glutamate--ammonia ligase]-adenylyl-L-tyrosine phosphorylase/[glutamate--ammonia-ligase] adenylyltransferase [Qipengyuania sp. DGS5-3]|uniref:bifunctional [glutamate--ammonia ligase]-adenylyl-L-tyrosine phosphorylase/[glutamate--ammonia-ligase] adenylyltransferase n=1 Tax=Qipengyuania sp. DGS5-3 TaxID=3349632 RepID=UPI0036D284E8
MIRDGPDCDWKDAIGRARSHAPFLAQALDRRADLAELLESGEGEAALTAAKASGEGIADTGVALRRERLGIALVLAIGDLAGAFPLARVMSELSSFADRALERAINAAIARRVPDAQPAGFIALALGKHGAGELNYSSDIDPILLYDPETLPRRPRDEPGEAAQRYAREIVRLLSDNTAEGYVFRVDLRLRPASEVSPLAISLGGATTHYESLAVTWERAAFIRARAAAGDIAAGRAFLETIRPFVWRRSLDFGAIEEIRSLSARVRARYSGRRSVGPGFNVKQGRGGIREIEFFAQTHQLIHGGRNPALRLRGTRAALDALAAHQIICDSDAQLMGEAYDRLRSAEHRLQMVEDRQTHELPSDAALDGVAQLDGLADGAALVSELTAICKPVSKLYGVLIDELDEGAGEAGAASEEPLAALAEELEETPPDALAERVMGWTDGRYRALKSPAALSAFDAIQPLLLEAFAASDDPEMALSRWETLLARMPTAINFFRLLEARPALFDLLMKCLAVAPPLVEEIARRPELLDILIDHSAFDLPSDVARIEREIRRNHAPDYERRLDRIRIITSEKRFALGVQLIEAAHDPLDIAAGLSRVAEAAIGVAVAEASAEFAVKHGRIPGADLLVLGLGRLGGGALTHASDLDLIFLHSDGDREDSDGERPLSQTLYFNRLAQRVSAALSVPTAEGALYEVDTRLRPQGAQGPLAVGLRAFEKYQKEGAWTWEHMALTRARILAGPPDARAQLDKTIEGILRSPRDPEALKVNALEMRGEMAQHKRPKGPLDAKLLRGGLVDLEFLVHTLQLSEGAALAPNLADAIAQLAGLGLVDKELGEAHDTLTRILVGTRLLAPELAEPSPAAADVLAQLAGQPDLPALLRVLEDARGCIADHWGRVFGQKLEGISDE